MKPCKGREGSSCDKNNNCTYPKCKEMNIEEQARKKLEKYLVEVGLKNTEEEGPATADYLKGWHDCQSILEQDREKADQREKEAFESGWESGCNFMDESHPDFCNDKGRKEYYEEYKTKKG